MVDKIKTKDTLKTNLRLDTMTKDSPPKTILKSNNKSISKLKASGHDCFDSTVKLNFLIDENKIRRENNETRSKEKSRSRSKESKYKHKERLKNEKHNCYNLTMKYTYTGEKPIATMNHEQSLYKNINNYRHIFEKTGVRDENVSWLMGLRELPLNKNQRDHSAEGVGSKVVTKPVEFNFKYKSKKEERLEKLIKDDHVVKNPYIELYTNENIASLNGITKKGSLISKGNLDFETTLRSYRKIRSKEEIERDNSNDLLGKNQQSKEKMSWLKYTKRSQTNQAFSDSSVKINNINNNVNNSNLNESIFASQVDVFENTNPRYHTTSNNCYTINDLPRFPPPMLAPLMKNYQKHEKDGLNSHPIYYSYNKINFNNQKIIKKVPLISLETSNVLGSIELGRRLKHKDALESENIKRYNIEYKDKNINNIRHMLATSSNVCCTEFESGLRLPLYTKSHDNRNFLTNSGTMKLSKHSTDTPLSLLSNEDKKSQIKQLRVEQKNTTTNKNRFALPITKLIVE